ncbi:MAG: DUF4389 domain-containing protein [Gaiellaceae bacterium]|jgi:hypothetical protein
MSDVLSTPTAAAEQHPIGLVVTDDLQRNRLTVFFRLLLALPHFIVVALWAIVTYVLVIAAWIVAIFTGRVPDGLHNFIATWLRYATRVTAYVFLLADPFPPFGAGGSYPVDARIDPAQTQSRLTVFFRTLLAIPALLLTYVFRMVNQLVALLGWFYCLFTGRMHEGMRDISAWLLRYETQTWGYVLLLTGRYPSLSGAPTA